MIYRFIGAFSEIGGVASLDSLGQKVDLKEPAALDAMRGGCALLPDPEYAKLGITSDEEKKFRYVGARAVAPGEFKEKCKRGLIAYQKLLDEAATTEAMGGNPAQSLTPPVAAAAVPPQTPAKKEEVK